MTPINGMFLKQLHQAEIGRNKANGSKYDITQEEFKAAYLAEYGLKASDNEIQQYFAQLNTSKTPLGTPNSLDRLEITSAMSDALAGASLKKVEPLFIEVTNNDPSLTNTFSFGDGIDPNIAIEEINTVQKLSIEELNNRLKKMGGDQIPDTYSLAKGNKEFGGKMPLDKMGRPKFEVVRGQAATVDTTDVSVINYYYNTDKGQLKLSEFIEMDSSDVYTAKYSCILTDEGETFYLSTEEAFEPAIDDGKVFKLKIPNTKVPTSETIKVNK